MILILRQLFRVSLPTCQGMFSLVFLFEVEVCGCSVLDEVTVRIVLLFSLGKISYFSVDFVGFSSVFGISNLFLLVIHNYQPLSSGRI